MKLLLDTHALLWWVRGNQRLSRASRAEIDSETNQRIVSAVSAMEVTTKYRLGKLPEAGGLAAHFEADMKELGFEPLPISIGHARLAGSLPNPHKDPFDRLLIAQALLEGMVLVSNEALFDGFGVSRLW